MVPRLIVTFSAQFAHQDWIKVATLIQSMPGVVAVAPEAAPAASGSTQLRVTFVTDSESEQGPGWQLVNALGFVADLGTSRYEASLMQLLAECRGVFEGRKTLFACLEHNFPKLWGGRSTTLGTVYRRLAARVGHTPYRLVPPRSGGLYGLERRSSARFSDAETAPLVSVPDVFVVGK